EKGPRRRMVLRPDGMSGCFKQFPCPVERVTGDIVQAWGGGEPDRLDVDLTGYAGDRPIRILAKAAGTKPDYALAVDAWGANTPCDEPLFRAPAGRPKPQALAESFHPTGLADFHTRAEWRPDPSLPEGGHFANTYVIKFHDAAVVYKLFPYRLEKVK